jgi:hypothetical protein
MGFAGIDDGTCANERVATAKRGMARSLFLRVLDLEEMRTH